MFDAKTLVGGESYLCRDGTVELLIQRGYFLYASKSGYCYSSEEVGGNLVYPKLDKAHNKDIVGKV
tara:strand:+ start:7022 stop:7219 length:198 start_codon:yes stop_codon:yes gene_type:complete